MKYERILRAIAETVWMIHPPKLEEIIGVIEARAAGVTLDADRIAEYESRRHSDLGRKGRIEVLGIHGTISQRPSLFASGATSTIELGRALDAAIADSEVGGILLDVDSGGGSVFGLQELSDKIYNARAQKPIVAAINPQAYSAAYWLATAAEEVFVQPSGMVGSVGTLIAHVEESGLNEKLGVKINYIHAGRYKVEGNSNEPLGDEARAEFQRHVDRFHRTFIEGLARNRNLSAEQISENFGEGRIFGADEAVQRGMADRVATFDEAIVHLQTRVARSDKMSMRRRKTTLYAGDGATRA